MNWTAAILMAAIVALILAVLGLLHAIKRLQDAVTKIERTVARMEASAQGVASRLAATQPGLRQEAAQRDHTRNTLERMEEADRIVAEGRSTIAANLADTHSRADATEGAPGAAADAALRTGDTAEAIRERQGS